MFEDDRKQIALSLDKILIPVENEYKKQQGRVNQKRAAREARLKDQSEEDALQVSGVMTERVGGEEHQRVAAQDPAEAQEVGRAQQAEGGQSGRAPSREAGGGREGVV